MDRKDSKQLTATQIKDQYWDAAEPRLIWKLEPNADGVYGWFEITGWGPGCFFTDDDEGVIVQSPDQLFDVVLNPKT
jgi:hypothetical protein